MKIAKVLAAGIASVALLGELAVGKLDITGDGYTDEDLLVKFKDLD